MSTSSPLPPINLINRMWEHFKEHGEMRHPSYGFDAKNLRFALLPTLERFRRLFPNVPNGLIVEKVFEDYNAESAGLQVGDVIFACDGIEIKSLLQLWELMFANVGKEVELEVARVDLKVIKNIRLIIGETSIDEEIYRWPKYDYR
ncbi:putative protease Do-like 14 [Trifolium pratense]|uniref:putative protease Do-like 14 n=1 Tax=Trifolium pratense TaxID=57577 RepID=UPI001E696A62|nr:putative protease Do-like 14 [Trifolium pratense]